MTTIRKGYCINFVLLLMILAAILARPVAFQKSTSIIEQDTLGVPHTWVPAVAAANQVLDVSEFLNSIPYRANPQTIYAIDPATKYRRAITQGDGNCSNLVFGAAYYLDRAGIDYQIIHLLPPGRFLEGQGHTVIRTHYKINGRTRVGIVDLLEGGLPRRESEFLDVADLRSGPVPEFSILSLNGRKDTASPYYGSFLKEARVAYIGGREVNRYFRFIEAISIPLGNDKVEKYVFDGWRSSWVSTRRFMWLRS